MKNGKGFTLIELLGVIAILALIVIIAAPQIVNQIKKSKNMFDKATISLIYSAADSFVDNKQSDYPNVNENTYCVSLETLIDSGELEESVIGIDKYSEITTDQIVKVTVNNNLYDYSLVTTTECDEYSNPSAPELSGGMIPIIHNGTNWVKADTTSEWYDYSSQEWANVVLVTDATRATYQNAVAGTVINEVDVLAYLVWIPRYRYKLFNVEAAEIPSQEIEIVFEDKWHTKSNGSVNDTWFTHPAFTFGDKELNGFWVGKFEITGNATTPTVKPGVASLRNQNANNHFLVSQKFSNTTVYGLTTNNDSHMIKNMEWGAVAYLTQSQYGKNAAVWMNPSTSYITGCAGNSEIVTPSSGCSYLYTTANGQQASTTGNIYGIYDMSGGSWEMVMGVMYNSDNTTVLLGSSGFAQATIDSQEMNKYINKYQYGITYEDQAAHNRRQLGDATGETRGWDDDDSVFVTQVYSWFYRGGHYSDGTETGIFFYDVDSGAGYDSDSTRVVILGE